MKIFCFIAGMICILSARAQSDVASQIVQSTFSDLAAPESHLLSGSFLPEMRRQSYLKGNRYLLNGWVKGSVIDTANRVINDPEFLFNYDKINKTLLVTKDRMTVIEVSSGAVKSFELKKDSTVYDFENLEFINNEGFVEVLAKGNRYTLYKSITTKFVRSNYYTDGLVEVGDPDDEFVDNLKYFIVKTGTSAYKPVELRKKSIKQVLPQELDNMKRYFALHRYDWVNEDYLKGLISYLNR